MEEIGFLKRTLKTKRSLASLRAGQGLHCSPLESRKPYEHSSTKISLLMDWVRTVSDFYNLKVSLEIPDRYSSLTLFKDEVLVDLKLLANFFTSSPKTESPSGLSSSPGFVLECSVCVRVFRWTTSPWLSRMDASSATLSTTITPLCCQTRLSVTAPLRRWSAHRGAVWSSTAQPATPTRPLTPSLRT